MNGTHDQMLDDVAVYALGSLSAPDAQRVRGHIATCEECRAEYAALAPAVTAVAKSAEACDDAQNGTVYASPLLKARIMREVRATATPASVAPRARRLVWPAYALAAACLVIAISLGVMNASLMRQVHTLQTAQTQTPHPAPQNAQLSEQTLADLVNEHAKRYPVPGGEIVVSNDHVYIAMHDMADPPKGHVYQAWTQARGAKGMTPAQTFVPDKRGVAVVALSSQAKATHAVAISIEPPGGSKAPTTSPIVLELLE